MERLISIITPCYNSEKFIQETYYSIYHQSYTNWEWIIVDDNSTDDSVKIIKEFNDKRIILIRNKSNKGAAFSRNVALRQAKGRFITFIDSDDLWEKEFLEKSLNFLNDNNEELVYSSYKRVDESLNPILDDFIAEDYINSKRILFNCPIPMLTSMYDSKRIGKVYFPEVELREDHAMWIELLKKIKFARANKESLGIYRMRANSVSRNKLDIAHKQFNLYYNHLNMNLIKSLYYTFNWGINGLKKYGKL
ncbi:glycosyltransferase family 2 protein [Faecalibacter macacae]|uniref:Glycosyltransferase family 2 protein n=1 Tax=Faecalibacter macacae TaxID=1859289 RepID=A0A3L9MNE2_9FLAO|nr:glycosyltransferase family A protein [Faecalibacter macacae]RLZ12734.1 glycosyltransferase family 2 protein [Faecalibacter macacae]